MASKTYNKIEMIVNGTERVTLYEDGQYKNFDRLHELCGRHYVRVNDELMNGPNANGHAYAVTIWDNAEPETVLLFIYDGGGYIVNDSGEAISMDTAVALMDDDILDELHREMPPCHDQELYDEYCRRHVSKFGERFTV